MIDSGSTLLSDSQVRTLPFLRATRSYVQLLAGAAREAKFGGLRGGKPVKPA